MNEALEELRATLGWGECGCGGRGVAGGALGAHRGSAWGADVVRMSASGNFWGADGTEVPCIRRWEEVWVEADDRAKVFRCDA